VARRGIYAFDCPAGLRNGQNFLTIVATGGDAILSSTLDASAGFAGLRQPRIAEIAVKT
jgi:hypothetical protein